MTENLKEKAYQTIKEKIVTCQYEPGAFLSEAMLMAEVVSSRTPIREALNKLEQERFLRIVPKKGIMVTEISIRDISEVYQVRELIEPQIIRLWGSEIPRDKLLACRKNFEAFDAGMPLSQRNQLDDQLHQLILDACRNLYLHQMVRYLYDQNQRIRFVTGQIAQRCAHNATEHLSITNRLLEREYERAARELIDHLENAKKSCFLALMEGSSGDVGWDAKATGSSFG